MSTDTEVLILGAGFGGIAMGHFLKRAGIEDFLIAEKSDIIGGTWRDNSYPGCLCDIPSHLYSFSFFPNPDWSQRYAPAKEILDYTIAAHKSLGLDKNTQTGLEFLNAAWDEKDRVWRASFKNGKVITCRFLISALGPLHDPKTPEIDGIDGFDGPILHSARWDHSLSFKDKKVALIGTGASAVQLAPELQKAAGRLILFQRTPSWVLPKHNSSYAPWQKALFRALPTSREMMRRALFAGHEMRLISVMNGKAIRKFVEKQARKYIEREISDPALREKLTPEHELGCKRILLSSEYYNALAQPNAEVLTGGLVGVDGNRLISGSGESREVDAIVFATGFEVANRITQIPVTGIGGESLTDAWKRVRRSYYGIALEGFPNFFLLVGPNTGLGHNSILIMIEAQAKHIAKRIKETTQSPNATITVNSDAVARYDTKLQHDLEDTVWARGSCSSWYQDDSGKVVAIWPGTTLRYRREVAKTPDDAYIITH